MVVRVDRIRDQHLHRTRRVSIQTVHERCLNQRALVDHVRLAGSGIDVHFRWSLVAVLGPQIVRSFWGSLWLCRWGPEGPLPEVHTGALRNRRTMLDLLEDEWMSRSSRLGP